MLLIRHAVEEVRLTRLAAAARRVLYGALLAWVLTGCAGPALLDDPGFNPPVHWGRHVVQRGETLYAIAWRYGRDYQELANANGIAPPYRIHPGQVIRLDVAGQRSAQTRAEPRAATPQAQPERSARATAPRPSRSPATGSTSQPPRTSTPPPVVTTPRPVPPRAAAPATPPTSTDNKTLQKPVAATGNVRWRWPHSGPIIAKFSSSGSVSKGIDIAGKAGDPILAAADGEVVYAGSGLLGYGKLIILNHSGDYLSAYAHNRAILVKEGDKIRSGQKIAEMGETGSNRVKLHFQIRKNGTPTDPLRYLPGR